MAKYVILGFSGKIEDDKATVVHNFNCSASTSAEEDRRTLDIWENWVANAKNASQLRERGIAKLVVARNVGDEIEVP